jgi:hypothetical protein
MIFGPHMYEFYLKRYAEIYFLVGKLEILLRIKVVTTLSEFAEINGYVEWHQLIPNTPQNRESIAAAKIASRGLDFESFLPFSFWRHLFRREYFAGLWVPVLHLAFLGIPHAANKASFKIVCRNMKRANNIRNRVAHFNLVNAGDHEEEVATLTWLINGMGGPSD